MANSNKNCMRKGAQTCHFWSNILPNLGILRLRHPPSPTIRIYLSHQFDLWMSFRFLRRHASENFAVTPNFSMAKNWLFYPLNNVNPRTFVVGQTDATRHRAARAAATCAQHIAVGSRAGHGMSVGWTLIFGARFMGRRRPVYAVGVLRRIRLKHAPC